MPEKNLRLLFEENLENKIVLPDFQRTFEWEPAKQKSLLASTLVNLSIGALLFLKGRRGDFHAKALGINSNNGITPTEECLYLLDGQQRLTSLRAFFTDFFDSGAVDWKETFDSLYSKLRYRWLIRLSPASDDDDFFGYNSLHFEDRSQTAEPSALLSYISSVPILKTKPDFWYHPNYSPKDEKGDPLAPGLRKLDITNKAAEKCMVPLYTLYNGDLHKLIIQKIASKRLEEIKYTINDDQVDAQKRKEMVVSYLKPVDETIADDISERSDDTDFYDAYMDKWSYLCATWATAVINYFSSILSNTINIMELEKSQVARAIAIFTAINEGGQKLSPFDLIVAKAASDNTIPTLPERIRTFANQDMCISENWAPIHGNITDWTCSQVGCIVDNNISKVFQDSFLNVLSAFVHTEFLDNPQDFAENLKGEYFKAKSQLGMTAAEINSYTELTLRSLARAHAFLQFRCGLVSETDLPYRLMLLPIAFVLADDKAWQRKDAFSKLEFWYWTSIFSGAYRDGQNEKSCTDSQLLYKWIVNGDIPCGDLLKARRDKMFKSSEYSDEDTLTGAGGENAVPVPQAIHSAILQFVLSTQPVDFLPRDQFDPYKLCAWTCAAYQNKNREVLVDKKNADGNVSGHEKIDLKLQDHHIIPLGSATRIGESSKSIRKEKTHPLNSPLNRTYISATANGMISDDAPDKYYQDVFPVALAYHMAPKITAEDRARLSENKEEAYVAILRLRFAAIKNALLKRLSDLVN